MTAERSAPWVGASATEYRFEIFDLEPDVPARNGIYIYAKQNDEGAWVPLYMGAGDLALRCTDSALLNCLAAKHAGHLHMRLVQRDEDRAEELRDLLARYENVFVEGCQPEAERSTPAT